MTSYIYANSLETSFNNLLLDKKNINFKANSQKQEDDQNNKWHNYPLKCCAYSNDIGEAVRPLIGSLLAKLSWLPAIFYVTGAVAHKATAQNDGNKSKELKKEILFQSFASLIIPITLVKVVGKTTHKILDKIPRPKKQLIKSKIESINWLHKIGQMFKTKTMNQYRAVCETGCGLLALALAVKPIDRMTEKVINKLFDKESQ